MRHNVMYEYICGPVECQKFKIIYVSTVNHCGMCLIIILIMCMLFIDRSPMHGRTVLHLAANLLVFKDVAKVLLDIFITSQ